MITRTVADVLADVQREKNGPLVWKNRKDDYEDALYELENRRCRREALRIALCAAQRDVQIEGFPEARHVRVLAERLETLAFDVSKFEDMGFMVLDEEHADTLPVSALEGQGGVTRSPLFTLPIYMLRRAKTYRAWADSREQGARHVQSLAANLENLAADMSKFEDMGFMVLDDNYVDMMPVSALEVYMLRRAKMYRAWAASREQWTVPRRDLLNRWVHLIPVIYVEAATGKPRTQTVAKLLKAVGIPCDESQLRLHLRELKRDFAGAYGNLLRELRKLHLDSPDMWP
jgi:hypothetical protein